jgi:hypothetical protein
MSADDTFVLPQGLLLRVDRKASAPLQNGASGMVAAGWLSAKSLEMPAADIWQRCNNVGSMALALD